MHAKIDGLILVQVLLLLQSYPLAQGRSTHGNIFPTRSIDLSASRSNAPGHRQASHVTEGERSSRVANNKFESHATHEMKRNAKANPGFLKGFSGHNSKRNGQRHLAEPTHGFQNNYHSSGHGDDLIGRRQQHNDRLQDVVVKTPVQLASASFRRPAGSNMHDDPQEVIDNLSPTNAIQYATSKSARKDNVGWKSWLASQIESLLSDHNHGTPLMGEDSGIAQTDSSQTDVKQSDQVSDVKSDVKEDSSLQANIQVDSPDDLKSEESKQLGDNVQKLFNNNLINQNIFLSPSDGQALQDNTLSGQEKEISVKSENEDNMERTRVLSKLEEANNPKLSYADYVSPRQSALSPVSIVSSSESTHEISAHGLSFGFFEEASGSLVTGSEEAKSGVSKTDAVKSEVSKTDAVKSEVSKTDAVKSEVIRRAEVSETNAGANTRVQELADLTGGRLEKHFHELQSEWDRVESI